MASRVSGGAAACFGVVCAAPTVRASATPAATPPSATTAATTLRPTRDVVGALNPGIQFSAQQVCRLSEGDMIAV